jgi:hypothetical protein
MWSCTLQINWKQRFFVPTDEEQGIGILAALLEQFPVIATVDDETDCNEQPDLAMPSAGIMQPIDLESWIIEAAEGHPVNDEEQQLIATTKSEREPTSDEFAPACTQSASQSACLPVARRVSTVAVLHILQTDKRTPAIQIGFNFAESES